MAVATNYNAQMNVKKIRKYCALDSETSKNCLETAMERLINLSARACHDTQKYPEPSPI
jgi:magnesium chelatase family protein